MKKRQRTILIGLLFVITCGIFSNNACQAESKVIFSVDNKEKRFTVKTDTLEAVFKEGMIVSLKNIKTGEFHSNENLSDYEIPRGLGCIAGNYESMRKSHVPWGSVDLSQNLKSGDHSSNYHYPYEGSKFSFEENKTGATVTWEGLSDGCKFFPDEIFSIDVKSETETGALCFSVSASSPSGGVFGAQVPLSNILSNQKFFMPSFGGLMHDSNEKPALCPYGGAPFYEAPVVAIEGEKGSVGLWTEDSHSNAFYAFHNWSGKSFSFAFEHLNLMPFEPHKNIKTVTWKINVFDGGWTSAMKPYKDWYAKYFRDEIKIRDSLGWPQRIAVIIDKFDSNPATLFKIAETFDPETVMFHFWNARAATFDKELPDWNPREGYIENVKKLHSFGFKTMAYVNTHCVNYNSPVFLRDKIREKFLTRKSSIWRYRQGSNVDLQLGDVRNNDDSADQFKGIKDGEIIYCDPLCPAWRKYHTEQMKWWNTATGTDANYEDTAGCAGDFGNGIIEGKSSGQGAESMMRELIGMQPNVPMASEYGPSPIAFATTWPLSLVQAWGNENFKRFRMHRQHPVSAYLFGNRPWIPVEDVGSDFEFHLITACSDALGGLGQMYGYIDDLSSDSGFSRHTKWRAQIFSRRLLHPVFKTEKYEKNLVCMYKDSENRLYKYLDDGRVQTMLGPDQKELYARIEKMSEFKTNLFLPFWPAYKDGLLFGLDPQKRYALFPGVQQAHDITIKSLPTGICVRRYYSDRNFAILVLDKTGANSAVSAKIQIVINSKFRNVCVNGQTSQRPQSERMQELSLTLTFPSYILFSKSAENGKYGTPIGDNNSPVRLVDETGIAGSTTSSILALESYSQKIPGTETREKFILLRGAQDRERTVDFILKVPDTKSAIKLFTKNNNSSKNGNGSIAKVYINGELVNSFDCAKENPEWKRGMPKSEKMLWDTDFHELTIPVGKFAGQIILFSLAANAKMVNNSDQQLFSIPCLVKDEAQEVKENIIKTAVK